MPIESDRSAHLRALTLFERRTGRPDTRRDMSADEPPEVLAILARLERADRHARLSFPTSDDGETGRRMLPLPDRVGSYRLEELIGEGGMGLVFAGVRDDGLFDHRVAIKLIHPDRFGPAAVRRFNRERRLLARLEHPYIARLIDGGVTDDGWPYIIMELIEGTTIDRHVTAAGSRADATVDLLIGTAEALQAAHEALVIHGDIKPDNILIRADRTPRLLDFGVARLADVEPPCELAGRTVAFCAPEVCRGDSSTTRSDIYSFGSLMWCLLSEKRHTSQRSVRIADPTLEAIAAKAMAIEPADRYDHIGTLLADLRHWRAGEPVSARRRDLRYVAGLFVRRHWLSSAIVGALIVGLVVAFVSALVAWRSANARIEDVRTLTHFQLVELDRRLGSLPNSIALRTRLAIEAQAYLSRLALDNGSPDDLRRDAADGFRRLALLQGAADRPSLGDPIAARASFAKALSILPRRDSPQNRAMRASILIDAAKVASGDAEPALAARLLARARPHIDATSDRARYLLTLSEVEQWNGQYGLAIDAARRAGVALAGWTDDPDTLAMRLSAIDLEAEAAFYAGDRKRARARYEQALDLAMQATRRWPTQQRLRWMEERANWALGTTILDAGEAEAAAPLLERAYVSSQAAMAADPADGVAQRRYRSFMLAYGQSLIGTRAEEGIALITRSQRLREEWWRQSPSDEGRQRDWVIATLALGDALIDSHHAALGCSAYAQALSLVGKMRNNGHLAALDSDRLAKPFRDGGARKACPSL